MPDAILLDLDNTLIDRSAAHFSYCQEFTKRFLFDWPESDQKLAIQEMVEFDNWGYTPRKDYFRWMAKRFSTGLIGPDELWEDYQLKLPGYFVVDQAVCDLVSRLSDRYALAIVTNGSGKNQRQKLVQTGLNQVCNHIVISGEAGFEKPHPAIFQKALDLLLCESSEALFVGDDPQRDIAGAANVGLQTCWVRLGRRDWMLPIQPDIQIETSLELETLLLP